MRKIFLILLCLSLLATGSLAFEQTPQVKDNNIPQATPPGKPLIGMLEQHLSHKENFLLMAEVKDVNGNLAISYYINRATEKDTPETFSIELWFLEQFTDIGRDAYIKWQREHGADVSRFGDVKFIYQHLEIIYADEWGNPLPPEEYLVSQLGATEVGGEVCDSNAKVIEYIRPTPPTRIDLRTQPKMLVLFKYLKVTHNILGPDDSYIFQKPKLEEMPPVKKK